MKARLKQYFAPGNCIIADCPYCGKWIDADAESCECGWDVYDEAGIEREPEEFYVQEP